MKINKLVPKRRFEGYTRNWETSRLNEMASFSKGRGYSKKDIVDSGNPIILYGHLYTNYQPYIKTVKMYANRKENSVVSQGEEVIVPSSGETATDIARASVVGERGVILGGDLNIIRPSSQLDPLFLALSISNGTQQSELIKRVQGTSVVHLYNSDIDEVDLLYPNMEEQQKIGSFFKHLDEMIALQERKVEKTKALKSAYLVEMFPDEGEHVPKRRFEGFTEGWHDTALGQEADLYQPKTLGINKLKKAGIPVFGANGYIGFYHKGNHSEDQITISARGENAGSPSYIEGPVWITGNSMVINTDKNTNINKRFLYYYFLSISFEKYITGGAQPQLTRVILKDVEVKLPALKEQNKIEMFFKKLDNIILNHQLQLNKLKATKQAYLHEMFV